ncbi:MAG: aldehyde dehydrogenase family protein [Chloroflexi bacterium]|nr:aldehyde dehydrogenase family protein [Chloroflexota bacterium]MYD38519.1 aldehyde dehydrogenase family protein [Chloroflexota bacterium]MYI42261.1 aldehyde dehydrogenase family protein [Chloroflexota bacterium]
MQEILKALGIQTINPGACTGADGWTGGGEPLLSLNPASNAPIATVAQATSADYERVIAEAVAAFHNWRMIPAPKRGEVIRELGDELRQHKTALGELVTLENGKIRSEGLGEVQEMIDICDFAVGLSRQLYGLSMHSERASHRMLEQWHPLGAVGIITAFNFPLAVWSWNAAIAAVCGDTMIWKPSPTTPLTAIAVQHICNRVMARHGCAGVFNLLIGGNEGIGERLVDDARLPLISFTGSTAVGRQVAGRVAGRLGRSILELGGNNAIIVCDDADLDLATRAIVFGAVGTAGQRCTSTRRLILQRGIADQLCERLVAAYRSVRVGDPMQPAVLMGPLINQGAVDVMLDAVALAQSQGGQVLYGGERLPELGENFMQPTIIRMPQQTPLVCHETFAPILYVMTVGTLDEAIAMHNAVPQGLSSAIFTRDLTASERFLSAAGSDCGIANVNIGTSGAEIGGAFGGEKDTGGGRESGSDAWKGYMRRQTNTINYSRELPLAQGVEFPV